jgi:hypothetical protein
MEQHEQYQAGPGYEPDDKDDDEKRTQGTPFLSKTREYVWYYKTSMAVKHNLEGLCVALRAPYASPAIACDWILA